METGPESEVTRGPAEPLPDTVSLALDSFVCRYVSPVIECYSPSLRQCVVLRGRSSKPSSVIVVQCSRSALDVCFPFEKYCEV